MINLKAAMALGFEEPTRCSPTPKILFAAVHETEIGTFRTRRSCCAMSDIGKHLLAASISHFDPHQTYFRSRR